MNITGSSAIAAIDFNDSNAVSVQFTSKDTAYDFIAKDATVLRSDLETTIAKGESVGRLIAKYRREGNLQQVAVW